MRRLCPVVFILSALMSFPDSALLAATLFQQVGIASSPNPVGSWARAVGMGGAFIAVADDATAASWNPAGLIQLERPELSFVGEFLYRKEQFSSDDHPEIGNRSDYHNTNLNYFSATYPFKLYKNMVVSINYQRLYDFDQKFDYRLNLAGPGLSISRDKHFSQDGYLGALGLAGDIENTPGLSLGATLNQHLDTPGNSDVIFNTTVKKGPGFIAGPFLFNTYRDRDKGQNKNKQGKEPYSLTPWIKGNPGKRIGGCFEPRNKSSTAQTSQP